MKGLEHKVVALPLDASDTEGDAVLLERLMARMADKGWAFASLATPTAQHALVAFTRPARGEENGDAG